MLDVIEMRMMTYEWLKQTWELELNLKINKAKQLSSMVP